MSKKDILKLLEDLQTKIYYTIQVKLDSMIVSDREKAKQGIGDNSEGLFDVAEIAGENSEATFDLAEMIADLENRVAEMEGKING